MTLPRERLADVQLAAKVAALQQADTYPQPPGRIEPIETHMSWVFLTDRHAYKLKKPVRYDFLDFSTLAARRRSCVAETELNEPLAPGVYLGVAALSLDARGRLRLEAAGEPIEWLVKMRRLPAAYMLDRLLREGGLTVEALEAVARVLIEFYLDSPPVAMGAQEYIAQYRAQVQLNESILSQPEFGLPVGDVARVHERLLGWLEADARPLGARAAAGRIVDGHGDLRPEHVCVEPQPVIFDRLEFNRRFRLTDPVDELGSLAMECDFLGAGYVTEVLFSTYSAMTGDVPDNALRRFYQTYRACLRARLAIMHTRELPPAKWGPWRARAQAFLNLARRYTSALAVSSVLQ